MVQKGPKRRGRPRAYDPTTALAKTMDAFWSRGYAATSLDDISAATGMNRPSLYAAFGDKRSLYLKTLRHYGAGTALRDALAFDEPLPDALRRVYDAALSVYLSDEHGARGCFVIGTAATEAVGDSEVRRFLAGLLCELDALFTARIEKARRVGELPHDANPSALGKIASATLLSLAIRSRAGEELAELKKTAKAAIGLICGPRANSVARPRRTRRNV
jgi:AcrR family transcriptional regulator